MPVVWIICTSDYKEQRTGNNINSAINGAGLIFDLSKLKR